MQATTLTAVQKVRRINLKKLVRTLFEDNASKAGRTLGSSHTYMWQILSGHRGIGEKSAREIEERLKLPRYALDADLKRTSVLKAQLGDGHSVEYRMVPVRDLGALDAKHVTDYRPCPVANCPADAFAVIADAGIQNTMSEFGVGDVLFVAPLGKRDKLTDRGLYVVRPRGARLRLWANRSAGGVLQARANGQGGWFFVTTAKGAKQAEHAFGDLVVLGRVMLIVRELR